MDNRMFCFQCEQTALCTGCTGKAGVCGKTAEVEGVFYLSAFSSRFPLSGTKFGCSFMNGIGFSTNWSERGRCIPRSRSLLLFDCIQRRTIGWEDLSRFLYRGVEYIAKSRQTL